MFEPTSAAPVVDPEEKGQTAPDAGKQELTEVQIDILVKRYGRELTRYEEASRRVEERIHQVLRANTIRALVSSRA